MDVPFNEATCFCHPLQPSVELPACPNGCGPLYYNSQAAWVGCPACGWQLELDPDEARNLTSALTGADPDLPLDLFLAEIARRRFIDLQQAARAAARERDRRHARWRIMSEIAADGYHAWQATCAEHAALLAQLEAQGEPTARLLRMPAQALWDHTLAPD